MHRSAPVIRPGLPRSPVGLSGSVQAQLVDLRSELTESKAEKTVVEKEVHDLLLQLHALQLQLHAKQSQDEDSDSIKDRLVGGTATDPELAPERPSASHLDSPGQVPDEVCDVSMIS